MSTTPQVPESFRYEQEVRGRTLAHFVWDELEKIAASATKKPEKKDGKPSKGPAMAGQAAAAPDPAMAGPATGAESPMDETPAQPVVGQSIEAIDQNRARGVPVVPPPPGYMFSPELAAFVPDTADPGWMSQIQAEQAQSHQSYYEQGAQDVQQQGAQQELDTQAEGQAQQMAQQQMAEQQAAMQQAPVQAQAQPATPLGGLQTPQSVLGAAPQGMPRQGSGQAPPSKGKKSGAPGGVTVKVSQ